jgi:type II secretory pathway component PulC
VSKKTRKRNGHEPVAAIQAAPPRRPWMLISLAAAAVALVFFVQLNGRKLADPLRPVDKVYSSAAAQFEPMAVSSHQTGLLEPAGVAKPLHLFAVKVGSGTREGLAVLGAAEASSRTYLAGALLENGARLAELYSDHVVLTRGPQRFTLYLPQAGKRDSTTGAGNALTVGDFGPAAPALSTPPIQVSDAVRFAAAYEGDQIVGFRVYAGTKAGQMERWGLKDGDVLVSLAGQPVVDAAQVDSALEQLAQGGEIDGEVQRGQERLRVTLDGSTLMASAASATPPPTMP